MIRVLTFKGLGIGCYEEACHAYRKAGTFLGMDINSEVRHINEFIRGSLDIKKYHVLDLAGGFLHGDQLGCAQNLVAILRSSKIDGKSASDHLFDFIDDGGIMYGQCNGYQVMVKLGILPGIDGKREQVASLMENDCGDYRVGRNTLLLNTKSVPFKGMDRILKDVPYRHGEGKLVFWEKYGSIPEDIGRENLRKAMEYGHVLAWYMHPEESEPTEEFPYNPNGSVEGIAGLVDSTGRAFGHMHHTECLVEPYHSSDYLKKKDDARRRKIAMPSQSPGLRVFENILLHAQLTREDS
jgi:phosphoribosylformylglycinamidine synthase